MGKHIRAYQNRDQEAVLSLLKEGLRIQEKYAAAIDPPEDVGFLTEEWEEHAAGLQQFPEEWWVYERNEKIIGLIWIRFLSDPLGLYGTVREVIVASDHRNLGIGTKLIHHAEALITQRKAAFFLISSFVSNPAVSLYRRLGFSDFPDRYKEDKNPNHVLLWKPLHPRLTLVSS